MNTAETQKSFKTQNSGASVSKEGVLSQFSTLKVHLTSLEKTFNTCDEHIKRMGIQKTRPQSSKKSIKSQLLNPNPNTPLDDLTSQLEQLKHHLKEREECLHADLAFLKKEAGIDIPSPPLFFLKSEPSIKASSSSLSVKKEPVEEHKLDFKDMQKKQELFKENKRIHQEIIKLRHLLESGGEKAKEIRPIVTFGKIVNSLDSLTNTNKLLRDQFQLASSLLNKAKIERKTKSIPLSKHEKPRDITDAQKQEQEGKKEKKKIHQENVKIHQEIVRLKELLKSRGESTKEIGAIVNLNKKSDSLDSLDKTNKLLKNQLQLASNLLNKAEIEHKSKGIPQDLTKKEEVKENNPKRSPQNQVDLPKIAPQQDKVKKNDARHHPRSRLSQLKISEYLRNGILSPNISLPQESQILEYKTWRNIFSHKNLSEIATIYCAFLNTTGGRLLLSVDEHKATKRGIVEGYELTPEEMQSLKELLSFKHAKIIPEPPAESFRLTFIPVEGGKYVVSIEIKSGDKKTYYGRDSGHLSYINTRVWNESTQQCEEVKIRTNDVERKVEDENDPRVIVDGNPEFEFTFDESFKFPEIEITENGKSEGKAFKNKHEKYQEEKDALLAYDLCRYIGKYSDQYLMQILDKFDEKEPYHALDVWSGLNNIEQLQSACIAKLQDLLQNSEKVHCEVEEG